MASVAGNEALAGAVAGAGGVAAVASAAAGIVPEGRQQEALDMAAAAVGVTLIPPVGLAADAAAALSLEEGLAAVAVVVDGGQLVSILMGEAAQPPGVVAHFDAAIAAAELLPVVDVVVVSSDKNHVLISRISSVDKTLAHDQMQLSFAFLSMRTSIQICGVTVS